MILEKETEKTEIKETGTNLGLDMGINKLISLSNGQVLGKDFKPLLDKLDRKQKKSKASQKVRTEIKQYIREMVNQMPWNEMSLLVMEELKNITKNTKKTKGKRKRVNAKTRKYLSRWNIGLLKSSIMQKAEENSVYLALVTPAYTSQTCSHCGNINKASRKGEDYKCALCGHHEDADTNAAKNILQRFWKEPIVPSIDKENQSL